MKKIFLAAVAAIILATSSFAAESKYANAYAKSNFSREFTKATNIAWSVGDTYTKATFNQEGETMEAFYNQDGDKIATSTHIVINDLPVGAKRTFAKKYCGYTVLEAIRFSDDNGIAYYISAKNDHGSVILKVDNNENISTYKK